MSEMDRRCRAEVTLSPRWVQLAWFCKASVKPKEAHVGRRRRRKVSQRRAEGRVRGRVRERVQGRRPTRGEEGAGRKRGAFDVGAIEGYANRLGDRVGGTSALAGAASGLAGAASGLAGGSFARRIMGSNAESSEEDFRKEIREQLDLIDQRLGQLEEQMRTLREQGRSEQDPGDLTEPGGEPNPYGNR